MAEISQMTNTDISGELGRLERELVTQGFQLKTQRLQNTAGLGLIRKQMARLHTEARRREISQGLAKGAVGHIRRSAAPLVSAAAPAPAERGGFLAGIVDKLTNKE